MRREPSIQLDVGVVTERRGDAAPSLLHPDWSERFPWLIQGTTTRDAPGGTFDLGLWAGASPPGLVRENWDLLLRATGAEGAVLAPQVHGAEVRLHRSLPAGLGAVEPCDGHLTDQPDLLLAVTVADCVPVFVVAPECRAVAVLHAGWRGTGAGVLEVGLRQLEEGMGARRDDLHVHLGPSICARCYEVGPEVFAALGQPVPRGPMPIDLRGVLAQRALAAGVPADRVTLSSHCTLCTGSGLFSHRGGDGGRQVGYIGVRA